MQFTIIKLIALASFLLFLVLPLFSVLPVYANESTLKITDDKLNFPLVVIPTSTGNPFLDSEPNYDENIKLPKLTNRKAWLKAYISNEIEGIGMGEVFQLQCQYFGKNNTKLCLLYWQWTQATTWTVMVDVVDAKGKVITRETFGRYGAFIGVLPYERHEKKSKLLIMERGIRQPSDANCCPIGRQLEMYQWDEHGLSLLTTKRLDEN